MKVTTAKNDGHDELKLGFMQMTRFEIEYGRQAGFNVSVDGTIITLSFYWSHLIDEADQIMFFGQLHQRSQNFYCHLQSKDTEISLFHVFCHIAVEYRGDALASTQLYEVYYQRLSKIKENKLVRPATMGSLPFSSK